MLIKVINQMNSVFYSYFGVILLPSLLTVSLHPYSLSPCIPTHCVSLHPYSLCLPASLLTVSPCIPTHCVSLHPYSLCLPASLLTVSLHPYSLCLPASLLTVSLHPYSLCLPASLLTVSLHPYSLCLLASLLTVSPCIPTHCVSLHPYSLCLPTSLLTASPYIPTHCLLATCAGDYRKDHHSTAEAEECGTESCSSDERQTWRRVVGCGDTSGEMVSCSSSSS